MHLTGGARTAAEVTQESATAVRPSCHTQSMTSAHRYRVNVGPDPESPRFLLLRVPELDHLETFGALGQCEEPEDLEYDAKSLVACLLDVELDEVAVDIHHS